MAKTTEDLKAELLEQLAKPSTTSEDVRLIKEKLELLDAQST